MAKPDFLIDVDGTAATSRDTDAKDRRERRVVKDPVEFRVSDDSPRIGGYAAVFNAETVIGGMFGFREQIAPGAFDEAIENDDVRALFNHDPSMLLGRTASGTLKLAVDKKGLRYDVEMPDTAAGRDVMTLVKRGDVNGSSFGFIVEDDDWDESEVKKGKLPLRTIRKASLFDVSPVTFPAYPQASVSARSKAQACAETAQQAKVDSEKRALEEALDALKAAKERAA